MTARQEKSGEISSAPFNLPANISLKPVKLRTCENVLHEENPMHKLTRALGSGRWKPPTGQPDSLRPGLTEDIHRSAWHLVALDSGVPL